MAVSGSKSQSLGSYYIPHMHNERDVFFTMDRKLEISVSSWSSFSLFSSPYPQSTSNSNKVLEFPGDTVDQNTPSNAGDMGSIPGLGRLHMLWSD